MTVSLKKKEGSLRKYLKHNFTACGMCIRDPRLAEDCTRIACPHKPMKRLILFLGISLLITLLIRGMDILKFILSEM